MGKEMTFNLLNVSIFTEFNELSLKHLFKNHYMKCSDHKILPLYQTY
jgi:hypothetical protein